MKEFYGDSWQKVLDNNGLGNFNALWSLDVPWFEKPNKRRGGWSGVAKIQLTLPGGEEVAFFLKRQENHITKTLSHPIRGIPTFLREFYNIQRFVRHGLPTAEPVYFAHRVQEGNLQAILITRELENYQSLNKAQFLNGGEEVSEWKAILSALAGVMGKMHKHHFQHNCLYPKHVFVKKIDGVWDVRLIDLEKLKWRFFKREAVIRDIGTLYRNEPKYNLGLSNQLFFLKAYMKERKLSEASKLIWRTVRNNYLAKKNKSHEQG